MAKNDLLRILAIGNSFSIDTMHYLYGIAECAGFEKTELGILYIGGCSLNTHAANAREDKAAYVYYQNTEGTWKTTADYKMSAALTAGTWDFIILQQASYSSGLADTYTSLDYLISYVREKAGGYPRLVWNMTWADEQDSQNSGFANYNNDQMTMYNAIISVLYKVIDTKKDFAAISPTGTAIQNARTSFTGDNLTLDGHHLNELGRYTAGLTFFYALTGISVENMAFAPPAVDENMKAVAQESALNAVANPRAVTNSRFAAI